MKTTEGLHIWRFISAEGSSLEYLLGASALILIGFVLLLSITSIASTSNTNSKPTSIATSNITDNSFTISWKTIESSAGYIVYGTNPENLTLEAYDNQAPPNKFAKFDTTSHAVTLTNLKPATYYYYKIVSNNKVFEGLEKQFFDPVKTAIVSPLLRNRYQDFVN